MRESESEKKKESVLILCNGLDNGLGWVWQGTAGQGMPSVYTGYRWTANDRKYHALHGETLVGLGVWSRRALLSFSFYDCHFD